jgi:hypothetical protein
LVQETVRVLDPTGREPVETPLAVPPYELPLKVQESPLELHEIVVPELGYERLVLAADTETSTVVPAAALTFRVFDDIRIIPKTNINKNPIRNFLFNIFFI